MHYSHSNWNCLECGVPSHPTPLLSIEHISLLYYLDWWWQSQFNVIFINYSFHCGPGSSVGIATGYGLDGPGIESRCGRFSAVQTGPGAHPASCAMGTGSFLGVKKGRGVLLNTPPSSAVVMEE